MFLASDRSRQATELPIDCSFVASDWHILVGFWHPVAYAHEVTDQPVAGKLLDVDLVIFRTRDGVTVAMDQCPHRGTRVSDGWLSEDRLVCPMHGLQFDATGQCVRIPSVADPDRPIPNRLRLRTFLVMERYGIIWTCLRPEPIWPLPEWEGIGNPALENVFVPADVWRASAARHVENFNDIAHFPWVHTQSFGGDEKATVPPYQVEQTDFGLRFSVPYEEGANRFPDGVKGKTRRVTYTYELTFPFSTLLKVAPLDSDFIHYFADTACPMSAHETRIFQVLTDTTGKPDRTFWVDSDALVINREDKTLVENQRPRDLPLDLREENHIPADRLSLEYRRALVRRFGLGSPMAASNSLVEDLE